MSLSKNRIYLASRSPRRRELLKQIGVNFDIIIADVDEQILKNEPAHAYVVRIAKKKAEAGWQYVLDRRLPYYPVLAADTVIASDKKILGKPADKNDAAAMLKLLSDKKHRVLTGIAISHLGKTLTQTSSTQVQFKKLNDNEIAHYIDSAEPLDKAGAYAIQGRGAVFISMLEGSYSGVVGLPLFETAQLLKQFGIEI